jgi:UDP-3-O-[3-hydroxymyristoyl] glucosamine N-acyltransferase
MGDAFIHEHAIVETDAIGPGTRIWAFSHVMAGAVIGAEGNVCDHTYVEGGVVIGDRVTIKSGVYLWDGLRIEDDVFIGPQATFTNDRSPAAGSRSWRRLSRFAKARASAPAR